MAITKVSPSVVENQVLSRRNIIINGAMQVAQRGTSATAMTSGGIFLIDRFKGRESTNGAATMEQSSDTPTGAGFGNSLKLAVTTADTDMGGGQFTLIQYKIVGTDLQQAKYGTSSAEKLTLSFWVKSAKTGTYIVEFINNNSGGAKNQSQSYTISSADTWEKKTITIDGDTSTAFENTTDAELWLYFWLSAGTNYTGASGSLNTSWTASVADNTRAKGVVNWMDSTSNNFYLTGMQLEVGDTATPFEHRSFGEELALCQRYCQKYGPYGSGSFPFGPSGYSYAATTTAVGQILPAELRASPSISFNGDGNPELRGGMTDGSNTNRAVTSLSSIISAGTSLMMNVVTSGGGNVTGQVAVLCNANDNNFMIYDAEL